MRKFYFIIAAVATVTLASCAKTESLSVPQDAIGFRTILDLSTKAADVTAANLASFEVTALNHADSSSYFSAVTFTKQASGSYTSTPAYYWPQSGSLDFYAYAPLSNGQVSKSDYKTFTITPSATASEQVDFVYANVNEKTKANSSTGVAINFRHAESKIALKVKNTDANLKFEIVGWKVVYVSKSGKFTYADASTDTKDASQLAKTDWSNLGTAAVTNYYEQSLGTDTLKVAASASTAVTVKDSLILVPQTQTAAAKYTASTVGAAANGSYIAIKFIIKNPTDGTVIYSDGQATPGAAWAMWPVGLTWEPGKMYTYTVNLAGGGYYETNADTDEDLDQILDNAAITFVTVTVDEWSAQTEIPVSAE